MPCHSHCAHTRPRTGLLVRDLFNPLKKIHAAHIPKYVYLLAYASFEPVDRASLTKEQLDNEMKPLLQALKASVAICSSKSETLGVLGAISSLREHVHFGIVAAGVVDWMLVIFTDPEFSITAYNLNNTTLFMSLMKQIAFLHESLRPSILHLISECFDMRFELDATIVLQLKRMYLDGMIYLLKLGYVMPTLDVISNLCTTMDLSLVRFVMFKLFDVIQPPYSAEFVTRLLQMLQLGRCKQALRRLQDKHKKEIETFLSMLLLLLNSSDGHVIWPCYWCCN